VIRVAILITVLVLLFFIYQKFQSDKTFKLEISATLALLLSLIIFYQYQNDRLQEKVTKLITAFNEGKQLSCNGDLVDNITFDYESGTMVFISKKIVDIKYPITSCSIKN